MSEPEQKRDRVNAPASYADAIMETVATGVKAGVAMKVATEGSSLGAAEIVLNGERVLNFGGCSYLALEKRLELRAGVIDAVQRYGTQLSFSRMFVENCLYVELEGLLERMTQRPTVATPTTSLGHIAALPAIVREGDIVLIDRAAHASLHTAVHLLHGVVRSCKSIEHNDLDEVRYYARRARAKKRVWYIIDGVYSMHGDVAPFDGLNELMSHHENIMLYVDDAHATSWTGKHGRGLALERVNGEYLERTVVALSLNKAFSAAGGAISAPTREMIDRIRCVGGPMLFSGPIQPPMLGAGVASARLHASGAIHELQSQLMLTIRFINERARAEGLELASWDETPIFFAKCGPLERTYTVINDLFSSGFYASPGTFPAVQKNASGVRFTASVNQSHDDVVRFMAALQSTMDKH